MRLKIRFFYWLSYALIALLVLSFFSVGLDVDYWAFLNSDTLYLPSLYKDLIIDEHAIKGWQFNAAPNFFPEMILYFIIMIFTGNFLLGNVIYAVVQVLIVLKLMSLIFKQLIPDKYILLSTLANILFSITFFIVLVNKAIDVPFYIVASAYHAGVFIMQLACIILLLLYLKKEKVKYLYWMILLAVLAIISDKLFLFLFSIPLMGISLYIFILGDRKKVLKLTMANIVSVLLGLGIFQLIKWSEYVYFTEVPLQMSFESSIDSFWMMKKQFVEYLLRFDLRSLFFVLAILSFCGVVLLVYKQWKNRRVSEVIFFYFLYVILFSVLVPMVPIVVGNYFGYDTLRYAISVMYFLLFNIPLVVFFLLRGTNLIGPIRLNLNWVLMPVLVVLISFSVRFYDAKGMRNYLNYYPEDVRVVDEIAKKEGLKVGLAEYWNANLIHILSRENLKVYPAYSELIPFFHSVNRSVYFDDDTVFDFVLIDNFLQPEKYNLHLEGKGVILPYEKVKIAKVPPFRISPYTHLPFLLKE